MRKRDLIAWQAIIIAALTGLAAGCALSTTDNEGPISSINAETYTVSLPVASDWVCDRVAAREEAGKGPGTMCGRQLGERTIMAAAVEEFSEEVAAAHAGEPAAAVLAFIGEVEAEARRARGDEIVTFSGVPAEQVTERAGTACSGYREETVDLQGSTRTVVRSLICIDPRTRRPIRLTYLEEFPAPAGQTRPAFEAEASEFFGGLRFL